MLKLHFWGLILDTSGARATKCSKWLRWGFILVSFVASPMLDNCSPGCEKQRKLRWYSGPASHPAPCWARSRTTKTTENTFLGFKYAQITIVLGEGGTASAVLDMAQNTNNIAEKSCASQVFTPSKASVIKKITLFGILWQNNSDRNHTVGLDVGQLDSQSTPKWCPDIGQGCPT